MIYLFILCHFKLSLSNFLLRNNINMAFFIHLYQSACRPWSQLWLCMTVDRPCSFLGKILKWFARKWEHLASLASLWGKELLNWGSHPHCLHPMEFRNGRSSPHTTNNNLLNINLIPNYQIIFNCIDIKSHCCRILELPNEYYEVVFPLWTWLLCPKTNSLCSLCLNAVFMYF